MSTDALGHAPGRALPAPLARRFEAIVFDWDGTAVPDRTADAGALRRLVEEACAAGLDLAVVTGTHVGNVDGQLRARPRGPGTLMLALNRGSELFRVDEDGPQLVDRRTATAQEDAALSDAAERTVERLAARGLRARIVSERLNRRKIDLIPEPEWADPPKARIAELLGAVQARLAAAGIGGLGEVVQIAADAAAAAGLAAPRITSDAKHVEIGLTDKADAATQVARALWQAGIAPGQTLVAGDEFGPLGGLPGSDAKLLVPALARATACSVGVEPNGVPDGVLALGGGPAMFAAVLEDQLARRRRRELPVPDPDPGWTLSIAAADPVLARVHESLLTLADGRVGTRGSLLVDDPDDDPGLRAGGVYAGWGADAQLLCGPRWNVVSVPGHRRPTARRVLDLHAGTLTHAGPLADADDGHLEAVQLSSLARPGTVAQRAHGTGAPPSPQLLAPRTTGAVEAGVAGDCVWMRVTEAPGSIAVALHDDTRSRDDGWVVDRVGTVQASPDGTADEQAALARLAPARASGFDTLLAEHRRGWARRWTDADIQVDGDPPLQLAVRLALLHLMGSVPDDGEAAVGARGLTGAAYRGHVFWDSDVYVLPFLAATHAPAARAMVEYRVRRLPVARAIARAQGRRGARFPWESATTGKDVTPSTIRNLRGDVDEVHSARQEEHIVADVAWAAAHYADWTGDRAFAAGPGRELLVQCARWWASRIEHDEEGRAHIRGVMGPDEYHPLVDDNAYTNVMARWTLRRAAADATGAVDGDERHAWLATAEALVDGYDPATGVYEQFDGFAALEPLVIADRGEKRPLAADLLLGAERTRGAQVVKQADVLMLHYLVPDEVIAGSLGPNLAFYEPRTAHGSTLSPGVHAALLARAGHVPRALDLLRLTARIDLDDIGQNTAGGLHLAAMGSVWRAFAFGLGGVRPGGDALMLDPVSPAGLDRVRLTVRFRGSRVRLELTPDGARVRADPPIDVVTPGQPPVRVGPDGQGFPVRKETP